MPTKASLQKLIIPKEANDAFRRAGYVLQLDVGQRCTANGRDNQISVWFQNRALKNQWRYKNGGKDYAAIRHWLDEQVKSRKPASFILVIVDSNNRGFSSRRVNLSNYKEAYTWRGCNAQLTDVIKGKFNYGYQSISTK